MALIIIIIIIWFLHIMKIYIIYKHDMHTDIKLN